MSEPLVTVAIPTYNRLGFLRQAVQSALEQTFSDLHVLVVDNASTDGSLEELEDLLVDGRLEIIRNETNIGVVSNFHKAITSCRTPYVKTLCSDDYLAPDAVRQMVEVLEAHPSVGIVTSPRVLVDYDGNEIGLARYFDDDCLIPGREAIEFFLERQQNHIGEPTAVMFRRSLYRNYGTVRGQDYYQSSDLATWFDMLEHSDLYHLKTPLCYFRQHDAMGSREPGAVAEWLIEFARLIPDFLAAGYMPDNERKRTALRLNLQHLRDQRRLLRTSAKRLEVMPQIEGAISSLQRHIIRLLPGGQADESGCCGDRNLEATAELGGSPATPAQTFPTVVSIITPLFNRLESTTRWLATMVEHTPGDLYEAVFVDDGSADGTGEFLTLLGGDVKVITNQTHRGFGAACVQGAGAAGGRYLVFMHNNSQPQKGWLEKLITLAESDPSVGAVIGEVVCRETPGVLDDVLLDHGADCCGREVDPISSRSGWGRNGREWSALLVKRALWEKLSGFERGFAGADSQDADFCSAIRNAGYRVLGWPIAAAHGGEEAGPDEQTGEGPVVSVVVPCYNQANYLTEAVESVVNQTYARWECIIVNDGSPDDTSEVALDLIARYPTCCIRLVEKENAGLSSARNVGITVARGKYILPLDSDDLIEPQMLEKAVRVLEEHPKVSIAYAYMQEFGTRTDVWRTAEWSLKPLLIHNILTYCALFSREMWEAVGGYNTNMTWGYEDWDFWIGCAERGYVGQAIPELLFRYRVKDASMYTNSLKHDAALRATIVLNHPKLFDKATADWAKGVLHDPPRKTAKECDGRTTVCLVIHTFPPHSYGGSELYALWFAKSLQKLGYRVIVVHPLWQPIRPDCDVRRSEVEGVEVWTINRSGDARLKRFGDPKLDHVFGQLLFDQRVDVVHFQHLGGGLSPSLVEKAHQMGIPTVLTLHDAWIVCQRIHALNKYGYPCSGPGNLGTCAWCMSDEEGGTAQHIENQLKLQHQYMQRILDQCDLVTAPTDYMRSMVEQVEGNRGRVRVVPLGLEYFPLVPGGDTGCVQLAGRDVSADPTSDSPDWQAGNTNQSGPKPIRLGALGNFVFQWTGHDLKGANVLLEAFNQLPRGAFELHMHGLVEGPYRRALESTPGITLHGPYVPEDRGRIFASLDCLVLPSLRENFPTVAREALFAGVPVVGSRVGGIPEIVRHEENGLLFEAGDSGDLFRALSRLETEPGLLARLKAGIVPPLGIDEDAAQWAERYRDLIGDARPPLTDKRISVIIPTFNRAGLLQHCLEGFCHQTLSRESFEVIVVDDHSDEDPSGSIDAYRERLPLTYIRHETNRGLGASCNTGLRAATGDYVLFFDDDDRPTPRLLAEHVRTHLAHPEENAAVLGYTDWDPELEVTPVMYHLTRVGKQYFAYPDVVPNRPLSWQYCWGGRSSLKRGLLREECFDDSFRTLADVEHAYRLRRVGLRVYFNPRAVSYCMRSQGFDDFCLRSHRRGEAIANLLRRHPDPDLEQLFNVVRASHVCSQLALPLRQFRNEAARLEKIPVPQLRAMPFTLGNQEVHSAEFALDDRYQTIFEVCRLQGYLGMPGDHDQWRERRHTAGLTTIVILTHNQWEDTEQCLVSIARHTPELHELIIVDNGSSDGNLEQLRAYSAVHPHVRVIANQTNRGFAAGNNQGLAIARGEYVLLLNNDTVVTEGWLSRMLGVFKRHPATGIVGPMTNYASGPQVMRDATYESLDEMERFAARRTAARAGLSVPSPRVVGFCLLASRAVVDWIGGLDERFGAGNFEDDDFCVRALLSGFEVRIACDSFVHHTGSRTFKGAGINYRQSILGNWKIFKAKWGLPAETPMEEGYRLPLPGQDRVALHVPLPEGNLESQTMVDVPSIARPGIALVVSANDQPDQLSTCLEHVQRFRSEADLQVTVVSRGKLTAQGGLSGHVQSESGPERALRAALTSGADYVVLLSEDVLVTKGWLDTMMTIAASDPAIAAVGPTSNQAPGPQRIKQEYRSLKGELEKFAARRRREHRQEWREVPYLGGFCLVLKSEAVEQVGGFDGGRPLEEALWDLYIRLREKEFKLAHGTGVYVHHVRLSQDEGAHYNEREVWRTGKSDEVAFWREWVRTKGREWPEDFAMRLDPDLSLQDDFVRCLASAEGSAVSILDIGAGPLTILGKRWDGHEVDITAVDPLAEEYDAILAEFGVTPVVRTRRGEVERLQELFPANRFDLVHMRNALDHSYDPVGGILQMLRVVKPGGYVVLRHVVNEASNERHMGFHQWNFCSENDQFVMWNGYQRIVVNDILAGRAEILVDHPDGWIRARIKKLRAVAPLLSSGGSPSAATLTQREIAGLVS